MNMQTKFNKELTAPHVLGDDFDFLLDCSPVQRVIDAHTPSGRASGTITDAEQCTCVAITLNAE